MKKNALMVFLFFSICHTAHAAEMRSFFTRANKNVYIDMASFVRLPDNKVRAWQYIEGDDKMYLVEIDCVQRMRKLRDVLPISGAVEEDHDGLLKFLDEKSWEYIGTTDFDNAQYKTWCHINENQNVHLIDKTHQIDIENPFGSLIALWNPEFPNPGWNAGLTGFVSYKHDKKNAKDIYIKDFTEEEIQRFLHKAHMKTFNPFSSVYHAGRYLIEVDIAKGEISTFEPVEIKEQ